MHSPLYTEQLRGFRGLFSLISGIADNKGADAGDFDGGVPGWGKKHPGLKKKKLK